jgi:hypothetical protein
MINERHTLIEPKAIRYNPICMTHILTIWHLRHVFHQRSLQQKLVPVT